MEEKNLKRKEKEGDQMEDRTKDYVANESLEEEVEEQECDLSQVEKSLEQATQVVFDDFKKRSIDATLAATGLQLIQDAREACAHGDIKACQRLALINRFLGRVRCQEST